nr:hypothetical protein [Bacteroidota bacterium]
MKKTEQPNQNPEEVVKQIQDENSESVEIADENLEQKKKTTVRGRKKKSTTESK